jgi:NitT/TauT family transport system permease protein
MPRETAMPRAGTPKLRLLTGAGILLIFVGWGIGSLVAGTYFVPAPWTTIADTALLLAQGFTWTQILITALRVCVGFAIGFLAGLAAGIAIGARQELSALLKPLVLFFQGMPPLLWAIPLVALMGIGHLPTITVIALITFPLVAVTIGEGTASLPRELAEMLSVFSPGFLPRMRELVLPYLAPFLAAALQAGIVLAVKASVTAEYFGANNGIGFQIQAAYMSLRIRTLFAWAAVLVLVILLASRLAPRIGRARPAIKRLFADRASVVCRPDDIRALKDAFTTRARASTPVALSEVGFSYGKRPAILRGVVLDRKSVV